MSLTQHKKHYTWDDYRQWPEDQRWEIIGGEALAAAAPSTRHQRISHNLSFQLELFFKDKKCQLFPAPTDVKLSEEDIVQPDIVVVCDEDQIKETHIEGPPSLVVEVLSPNTENYDRIDKLNLYARFGIKEFWLVKPFPSRIEIFVLDGDTYRIMNSYAKEDTLKSPSFPELKIVLSEVFDFPLKPEEIELFKVKESPAKYAEK